MTTLTLLRHGQASLGSDDYDRLSELGHQQARLLGRHWAISGTEFDRVVVGPLRRHQETLRSIAQGFADHGRELPEGETVHPMREHEALRVIDRVLLAEEELDGPGDPRQMKAWFERFDEIMRGWIGGRLAFDDIETWQQARKRVDAAIRELGTGSPDERVLAVTSGGFVCMAVGAVLELDDVAVYELSLELRNTAWAEIKVGRRGTRLSGFNLHPHLVEPELHTLV